MLSRHISRVAFMNKYFSLQILGAAPALPPLQVRRRRLGRPPIRRGPHDALVHQREGGHWGQEAAGVNRHQNLLRVTSINWTIVQTVDDDANNSGWKYPVQWWWISEDIELCSNSKSSKNLWTLGWKGNMENINREPREGINEKVPYIEALQYGFLNVGRCHFRHSNTTVMP